MTGTSDPTDPTDPTGGTTDSLTGGEPAARPRPGTRAEQRRRTELRILARARDEFSTRGYDRATIRAIAAAAGVDPGLVMRYFGSKEALFGRAAEIPDVAPEAGPSAETAERMLAALTAKLETDPTPTLAMLRSMLTHPEATAGVREALVRQQHALGAAMDAPDAALRTGLFGALTLGVVLGRYVLELDGLCDATAEEVTAVLRPCVRALTSVPTRASG